MRRLVAGPELVDAAAPIESKQLAIERQLTKSRLNHVATISHIESVVHSGTMGLDFCLNWLVLSIPHGVLFDLDNTLIDRDGALRRWLHELGLSDDDLVELEELDQSGTAGTGTVSERLADHLNSTPARAEQAMREGILGHVVPDPIATAVVRRISERVPVAVVTNGGSRTQRQKMHAGGLEDIFGERVFISAEHGSEKPDARLFERALRAFGCAPSNAIVVGDDPVRDIGGAAALEIRSVWISRGRQDQCPTASASIVSIAGLEELLDL